MEDQEINKQLKSQNLKGKIALILGVINLILLLLLLIAVFGKSHLSRFIFILLVPLTSFGGTFLIAVIGIIFGFLSQKTTMGKIGIILCIINLLVFGFFWCYLRGF